VAWTAPRTWVASEVVTAAIMNTHIRDNMLSLGAAWAAYTPVLTATTTNPTLGNGTLVGAFIQPGGGKTTDFRIVLTIGSTTTVGSGTYLFTLPVTPVTSARIPVAQVIAFDTSAAATKNGGAYWVSGSSAIAAKMDGDTQLNNASPFAWAAGDTICAVGTLEAA
jgi:hypothetical protein